MITAKVDQTQFNSIFKEYLKYSKREIADSLNAKAYFIACNATEDTKKVSQERIEAELRAPSQTYPKVPLAGILVNVKRRNSGKKGLHGEKMKSAIEKFVSARKRGSAFIASSWIGAIKAMAPYVKMKSGKRQDPLTKQRGAAKGGATPAKDNKGLLIASIWSNVRDKKSSPELEKILQIGAQKAFDREAKSMLKYISDKLDKYKGK
jgi:hypothetical protein